MDETASFFQLKSYIVIHISEVNNYMYVCLFVTDILNNGSYVLFSDRAKEDLEVGFDITNIEEGTFLKNIISRKKQIIPVLMDD